MEKKEQELQMTFAQTYTTPKLKPHDPLRIGNEICFGETENAYTIMTLIDHEPNTPGAHIREHINLQSHNSRN